MRRDVGLLRQARNGSPNLGAETSLVELLLLVNKALLLIASLLLVKALPLPLVETTREGPRAAAHEAGPEERGRRAAWEGSGCISKDDGCYHGGCWSLEVRGLV